MTRRGEPAESSRQRADPDARSAALRVIAPGPLLLVQDAGRPGLLDQGVSSSGFSDRSAARRANRLVGNPEDAAVLEGVLGGIRLVAEGAGLLVAVSGVQGRITVTGRDGRQRGQVPEELIDLPHGAELHVHPVDRGLRPLIAVRGGIAVPPVLGSRSRDTLALLGPAPVREGDLLAVGAATEPLPPVAHVVVAPPPAADEPLALRFWWGPRDERLTGEGRAALLGGTRTVSSRGDRVGIRLDGDPLAHSTALLPSEPTVAGAIELPADGVPFVLMRDHPVTVGYPVVGVVVDADLDRLAQARPGTPIRLRPID